MKKAEELFHRMTSGETVDNNEEFKKDFKQLEELTMSNPEIMEHATLQEIQSYLIIDEISDEDFNKMLKNIAEILESTQQKTKADTATILKMEREFLKILLIERWTNRAENLWLKTE